jgi:rubrerythrin
VVRAYTTVEWIILARGVHGDKYDYSKVDYKDQYTDVEVICPEHDSFWVQPKGHIASDTSRRKECPICKPPGRRVIDTSVFIEDAMAVHGDKYDYSKVDYKNNQTKCEIICPDHGSFHLTYKSHIMRAKTGCPICEVISKAEKRSGTQKTPELGEHDPDHPERTVQTSESKVQSGVPRDSRHG